MKEYFDLKNNVAVITGASTGLGLQMAHALAKCGSNVVLLARREELIKENANKISELYNVKTLAIRCDITSTTDVQNAVKKTIDTFGKVDILVNNAGTGHVGKAEDITDEQFENEVRIDLTGTFKCAREFGKEMIKANYGRIINIASMYGLVGNMVSGAEATPYHAAKGGVVNLTRALAAEWGKHGITVNAICPGYFETPLTKETLETEWFKEYAKSTIPVGRYGHTRELDTTVIFLSSKMSTYVNGVNLPVDGGYTCI
ncbi:MAG: SDR family oxidoreductase [Mollicutes bacterium]|nr:SDR family oxidoreductase [Mollicutes bacterium]